MTIVQALYDAIHEESAAIAPQTSRLIEIAKVAALEITRLQTALQDAKDLARGDAPAHMVIDVCDRALAGAANRKIGDSQT